MGTDPRINSAREKMKSMDTQACTQTRTHTHTACSVFSCESWHFSSACQSNDRETAQQDTVMLLCMLESYSNGGRSSTLTSPALSRAHVCVWLMLKTVIFDAIIVWHRVGHLIDSWLGVALPCRTAEAGPAYFSLARTLLTGTNRRTHFSLCLWVCLSLDICLRLFLSFFFCVWMFVPSVCWSARDRARCGVLRIAHIVLCAAQR